MKYEILGGNLPVVICNVEKNETIICDSGAMSWMDPVFTLETSGGGFKKSLGRMFSGETIFQNFYHANEDGKIAFASCFPGSIRAIELEPGRDIIIQKSAFLASETSVKMNVEFQKKFATGLFSGEGFILNRLSGNGVAFLEIDGSTVEYDLAPMQQIVIDSGYLAYMDATCTMDIQSVKGMKNKLLGGEGFFNTVVTGPGKVVLQTMPINKVASVIAPMVSTGSAD